MKTDAAYLTEHVIGRYLCPCGPSNKRRIRKRYIKEIERHAHGSVPEIVACMAACLEKHLNEKLSHVPRLAREIAEAKVLGFSDSFPSLNSVLCKLIQRDNLDRCQTVQELLDTADLVTAALLEKNEKMRAKLREATITEVLAKARPILLRGRRA